MDNSYIALYGIGYGIALLAQLLVLTTCIILLIKQRSLAALLMFLGSLITLLLGAISAISNVILTRASNPEMIVKYQWITYILREIGFLVFAIGLLMLILRYLKQLRALQTA